MGSEAAHASDCFSDLVNSLSQLLGQVRAIESSKPLPECQLEALERYYDDQRDCIIVARDNAIKLVATYATRVWCDVGSRRNATVPTIGRLPDEIFSTIFAFGCLGDTEHLTRLAPFNVAAVSKGWRNIALNTPRIWTRIHRRSAAGFLPRAKSALLDVFLNLVDALDPLPALVLPYSEQWRTLDASFNRDWRHYIGGALFNAPVAALEEISLKRHASFSEGTGDVLPSKLFSGTTPRLRKLSFETICCPLTSPIFSGLAELSLTSIGLIGDEGFQVDDLFSVLTRCPQLEVLRLRSVELRSPSPHDIITSTSALLSLPSLRIMILSRLSASILPSVLSSVQPSSVCRIEARALLPRAWGVHNLLPRIPNVESLRKLSIILSSGSISINGWGEPGDLLLKVGCSLEDAWFCMRSETTARFLRTFTQHYRTPNLQELHIRIPCDSPTVASEFCAFAKNLPLLTDIEFVAAATLVHTLVPVSESDDLIFPRLRRLRLNACPIRPGALLEIVGARRSSMNSQNGSESGLISLHLIDCANLSNDESVIRKLRNIVSEVTF